MGLIPIPDHEVPERLGFSVTPREAAHLHDRLDGLSEETTKAIGFRLGLEEGVDDRLPVIAQSDESLDRLAFGVNVKLAEIDLGRDALLPWDSDDSVPVMRTPEPCGLDDPARPPTLPSRLRGGRRSRLRSRP